MVQFQLFGWISIDKEAKGEKTKQNKTALYSEVSEHLYLVLDCPNIGGQVCIL